MNSIDPILPQRREAKLRYLDHDFEVLQPGEFVRCGVTGDPIHLDNLKYWSIARQVAYKSAKEAFSDYVRSQS